VETRQQQVLASMKSGDARLVRACLDESKRSGGFNMIFPCTNAHYYLQFFQEQRPANRVLADFFASVAATPTAPLVSVRVLPCGAVSCVTAAAWYFALPLFCGSPHSRCAALRVVLGCTSAVEL
jgi:hypothetical protein